jgi:hypothetical protein
MKWILRMLGLWKPKKVEAPAPRTAVLVRNGKAVVVNESELRNLIKSV